VKKKSAEQKLGILLYYALLVNPLSSRHLPQSANFPTAKKPIVKTVIQLYLTENQLQHKKPSTKIVEWKISYKNGIFHFSHTAYTKQDRLFSALTVWKNCF